MNYAVFDALCKDKGTSPTALSQKLGLSKGNASSWKRGGNPSVEVLLKITEELNCTTDELVNPNYSSNSKRNEQGKMTFVERVDFLIEKRGISRNQLFAELKLGKNSFVNWSNRGTLPKGTTVEKLAKYFNVSVDYLLTGNEPMIQSGIILSNYRTNHELVNEKDKRYIRVVRLIKLICGDEKTDALLSAAQVPANRSADLTDKQLEWITAHIETTKDFFDDNRTDTIKDSDELRNIAKEYLYYSDNVSLEYFLKSNPEFWKFEQRYMCLYALAMQSFVNCSCFEEIIDIPVLTSKTNGNL
ncbi:MAG: transcriptional regulator [Ruminococcus sp.]|nr:transcriptional regulator [Ruminococcus sp.]